jgi:hypothetical protein
MPKNRLLLLCALAIAVPAVVAAAQSAAPAARIAAPLDETRLVTLAGNVHPSANAANDRGLVSSALVMDGLTLVLSRGAEQQAAFDAFVASQYDASSPNYHLWLTPAQIGERFGPAESDIAQITGWLSSHGFAVKSVAQDRMTIDFSGTAGQVGSAFHTEIHNLSVNGAAHIANMSNPQIPEALAPVIFGVKGLHNFLPRPLHKTGSLVQFNSSQGGWERLVASPAASLASGGVAATAPARAAKFSALQPMYGYAPDSSEVVEDVTPNDFATIYNVKPLWNSSITGTGQTIAILGTSDVNLSDMVTFKSTFGLPAGLAPIIVNGGADPGVCTSSSGACNVGDLEENTLDVEWSGAVAPGAQVVEVTTAYNSQSNPTNDPLYSDARYVISNVNNSGSPLYNARIMSLSYGQCELGNGTAANVAYRNLWQTAAAAGIAVFVATGDSGSPGCDQGGDSDGVPYEAQYGLAVNGLGSSQYNTAVGGTDFSWCKPSYSSSGNFQGCASTNAAAYWSTSNAGNESNATNYVPEIPWNDSCLNPIQASFIESVAPLFGYGVPANAEAACNFVYNDWLAMDQAQVNAGYNQFILAPMVDSVGGGGGASNCVVNDNTNSSSCLSSITSTGLSYGSLTLVNDGWPKPGWQTGVSGIPTDGVRDIPDVSFFAGDGSLNSATIICLAYEGATCTPSTLSTTAIELGGTSVATPEMAGVMALINQKAGSSQGNPNAALYTLASRQTYSNCKAEGGTTSNGCYFNDIDTGTNAMPCDYNGLAAEGGVIYNGSRWVAKSAYAGLASPNCSIVNTGDVVGTLSGFSGATGYDLATGLGSLNVANVVNAANLWTTTGPNTSTVTVTPASGSIYPDLSLSVPVTVSGAKGTPTGTVILSGAGYTSSSQTLVGGSYTFTIPADSLTGITNPFVATLVAAYSGDATYAFNSGQGTVTVTKRTPTAVTVTPASSSTNSNVPLGVTVTVTGSGASPSGTVTLAGGSFTGTVALSGGSASFTIPANTFTVTKSYPLNASYSGDNTYVSDTGSASVSVTYIQVVAPTVTVTPASNTSYTGQSLGVTVKVTGTNGNGTGNVTLSSGTYTSAATALSGGSATIVIPANSLAASTDTLTASFPGDSNYFAGTGTATVNVSQSTYALSATTPSSINRGSTATSTITGTASSNSYTGSVTATGCSLTAAPTGAAYTPYCNATGTITYTAGTPSGSITATVTTTAASAELVYPKLGNGKGWLGAGSGALLALLVFFGVPARRRSWRAILGMVFLLAALASLSACGGGGASGGGSSGIPGTTSGAYTFTLTGTGTDILKTTATTTFIVTVN